jgi:hypothetical protein
VDGSSALCAGTPDALDTNSIPPIPKFVNQDAENAAPVAAIG